MMDENNSSLTSPLQFPRNPALSPAPAGEADGTSPDAPTQPLKLNFIWPPLDPNNQPPTWLLMMNRGTESCLFKTALSGVAGGCLGLGFGLFFGGYASAVDKAVEMQGSTSLKLRVGAKEAWRAMASYAKNFARFGMIFSIAECTVEKYRARHDMVNSIVGGCVAGAGMASAPFETIPARARATQMAIGCASVGAFSAAIDYYMEYME